MKNGSVFGMVVKCRDSGSLCWIKFVELYLTKTRGFCAGIARAVDTLEALLECHGPPIYVRHAIVHNNVVKDLTQRGAIFVEDIEEVPHSSNLRRLVEVAKENDSSAHLIETPEVAKSHHLKGARRLGLTASASAPEHLVQGTIKRLRTLCGTLTISEIGAGEYVTFRLPPEITPSVGG